MSKSMNADHSPLPWRQSNRETPFQSADVYSLDGVLVAMCGDPEETHANADAEYIVRACNYHERLVQALSQILHDNLTYEQCLKLAAKALEGVE